MKKWICKTFGHKISEIKLLIWQIENNPVNVKNNGFTSIQCPRCKKVFDPSINNKKEEK